MNIPKVMTHIWIGPKEPPLKWMNTWKEKHPDWKYKVFGNKELESFDFKCAHIIEHYLKEEQYAGVADIIRYELLYKEGGFIPPADAICLENTDELWIEPEDYCYTVYEQENFRPGFVSPIYACNSGNTFVKEIIDELMDLPKHNIRLPFQTTGNEFLGLFIIRKNPKIKIFPSHYFIPTHFWNPDIRYAGTDKVYAEQMWGTTKNIY